MNDFDQPVAEGETHTVDVESYGDDGDGLAFVEGLAVFVPGTQPGERVVVKIEYVGETHATAKPIC